MGFSAWLYRHAQHSLSQVALIAPIRWALARNAGVAMRRLPPEPMGPLSKSKIIAFRQCPKRLWLEVHKPELREDSPSTLATFRVGQEVGKIARRIYDPSGKGVEINAQRDGYPKAYAQTDEYFAKADRPVFEAGLRIEGALAFADIMLPVRDGRSTAWRMVEVKSSASVKDYQRDDVAVQSHIATASGVRLKSVSLACIDSSWVYPGGGDYKGLLFETDLTEEALSRDEEAAGWISEAQKVAARTEEPAIRTGDHCHDPYECGFCTYCRSQEPQPQYPITWLPRLSAKSRTELRDRGIDDMRSVPDDMLNEKQLLVKRHTLAGTTYFDARSAADDLEAHGLPAYFLDFETVNPAVPLWKGTRPYQPIPFQFSLHRLSVSGELAHQGFLDLTGNDPASGFVNALVAACGKKGPIFVYYAGFESSRIRDLAERQPRQSTALLAILERIVDLLPIARERYYHPSMRGSWSIKDVLPTAAPDLAYTTLEGVQEGGMAMEAFFEAIRPGTIPERKAEIRTQLEAYCRLDTYAMVLLWHLFSGRKGAAPADSV